MRILPQALALAALGVLGGGFTVAQAQDAQNNAAPAQAGQRSDGQIEMDVVHALDASKALKEDMITAATIQGEVTLTGTVSTAASSELAEAISAHVAGVSKVDNKLQVGNPQNAQTNDPAQQTDEAQDDANQAPPPPPMQGQNQAQGQDQSQMTPPPPPQDQNQYPNQNQNPNNQYPNQDQSQPPPPPPGYGTARPQYAPQPGYGQPGYGQQGPYGQQGQYAQGPPQGPRYAEPTGPVTIPQGTMVQLRTSEGLDAKHAKDGQPVQFTVIRDVAVGGVLALPKGATVHGVVTEAKHVGSGDLGGSSELALRLTSLDLGGQSYPIDSDQFKVKGPNKAGETVGNAVGGGILGTIIGCAVGRGVGCAIGAGAGVAAGVGASAASSGPNVWIPAEALVTFHLNAPLTVNPVGAQEAARLAQGLYPGGPNLYRRGYYGGGPYYAGAYPYGYGPVYYRPYYMVGGAYYWR